MGELVNALGQQQVSDRIGDPGKALDEIDGVVQIHFRGRAEITVRIVGQLGLQALDQARAVDSVVEVEEADSVHDVAGGERFVGAGVFEVVQLGVHERSDRPYSVDHGVQRVPVSKRARVVHPTLESIAEQRTDGLAASDALENVEGELHPAARQIDVEQVLLAGRGVGEPTGSQDARGDGMGGARCVHVVGAAPAAGAPLAGAW